jgi:hypothetical protein
VVANSGGGFIPRKSLVPSESPGLPILREQSRKGTRRAALEATPGATFELLAQIGEPSGRPAKACKSKAPADNCYSVFYYR